MGRILAVRPVDLMARPELRLELGPLHAQARPDKSSFQGISWNYSIRQTIFKDMWRDLIWGKRLTLA